MQKSARPEGEKTLPPFKDLDDIPAKSSRPDDNPPVTVKMEVEENDDDDDDNDDMGNEAPESSEDPTSSEDEEEVPKKRSRKTPTIKACKPASTQQRPLPPSRPAPVNVPNVTLKIMPMQVVKRVALTLKEKLDIIERLKNGENQCQVAASLKLNHSTINKIWTTREKIEKDASKGNLDKKKCRRLQNAELDDLLVSWVDYMKAQGTPVNGTEIREQAKILAKGLGDEDFCASAGWLDKFKKRSKIILPRARKHGRMLKEIKEKEELRAKGSLGDNDDDTGHWDAGLDFDGCFDAGEESHPTPALTTTTSKSGGGFQTTIKKTLANKKASNDWLSSTWLRVSQGYEPENIFFVDEFGLFYRTTPENYKDVQGLSCFDGECPDERLSILFGVNALGTERLKLVVVGDSPCPSSFGKSWSPSDQEKLPTEYWFHPKAFVTPDIVSSWLCRWNSQMESGGGRSVLLIMNNSRVHQAVESLCSSLSCIKIVLPSGLGASVLRYLENDLGTELKILYKKLMLNKLIRQSESESEPISSDTGISILDASRMLHTAWVGLEQKVIAELFKKSGLVKPSSGLPLEKKRSEEGRSSLKRLIAEVRTAGIIFPKQLSFQNFVDLDENLIAVDMSVGILDARAIHPNRDQAACATPPHTNALLNNLDHLGNWAVANHSGDMSALHDAISTIQNFCAANILFSTQTPSTLPQLPSGGLSSQPHQQSSLYQSQNSSHPQHSHSPSVSNATSASNDFSTVNNKSIVNITQPSSSSTPTQQNISGSLYQISFPLSSNFGSSQATSQQISCMIANGQMNNVNLQGLSVAANLLQQQQQQQLNFHDHNNTLAQQYFDHRGPRN